MYNKINKIDENPFLIPSDEQVFLMREQEKQEKTDVFHFNYFLYSKQILEKNKKFGRKVQHHVD